MRNTLLVIALAAVFFGALTWTGIHTDPKPIYAVHIVYGDMVVASYTDVTADQPATLPGYKTIVTKIAE